jgi:hypothetical protein
MPKRKRDPDTPELKRLRNAHGTGPAGTLPLPSTSAAARHYAGLASADWVMQQPDTVHGQLDKDGAILFISTAGITLAASVDSPSTSSGAWQKLRVIKSGPNPSQSQTQTGTITTEGTTYWKRFQHWKRL